MLMLHKAVSVSLPTWKANVGYEEGEDWVLGKMKTGYPRFARPYKHFNGALLSHESQILRSQKHRSIRYCDCEQAWLLH